MWLFSSARVARDWRRISRRKGLFSVVVSSSVNWVLVSSIYPSAKDWNRRCNGDISISG